MVQSNAVAASVTAGSGQDGRRLALSSWPVLDTLWCAPGPSVNAPALAVKGVRATRNPSLLFRLSGLFLLRLAERRFLGLLFQEPPRSTRLQDGTGQAPAWGHTGHHGSSDAEGGTGGLAPENRVSQTPGMGVLGMSDPASTFCRISSAVAVPARNRSRKPRSRLRNRRTLSSGSPRYPGYST